MESRSITQITDGLVRISEYRRDYLGVHVSTANNSRAAKQFAERAQKSGWIVHDNSVSSWRPEGFVEHDGHVYLYGPYVAGRTVQEVLSQSAGSGIAYVLRLTRTFAVLKSRNIPLPVFQSNGILFLDDGGVLLLPAAIMERIRSKETESERLESFERYNHPDLTGEARLSFSIAVLVYRLITGTFPFKADSEEEFHSRMREMRPIEPRLIEPGTRADVSSDIAASLDNEGLRQLSLDQWLSKLEDWNRNGYTEPVAEDRKEELLREGRRLAAKALQRYNTHQYFRRHWRTLAVAGIVAFFIGSIVYSILSNVLAPPVTVGMEPREVVELFYSSITEMGHAALEDSVTDGAGKAEVTEATNLFVMSRVRLGQEGTTGQVQAAEWKDAGQPDLEPQYHVYGIAELQIEQVGETEFIAHYEKWEHAAEHTRFHVITGTNSVAYRRTDRLFLRRMEKHDNWAIYRIDRVVDELLDSTDLSIRS